MIGNKVDILKDSPAKVFVAFSIPSVFGLLAISSAETIDGIFIGNFAGSSSLAAINLVIPFFTLIFGFGIMLVTGSSVRCGKYIGEDNRAAANALFSRTLVVLFLTSVLISVVGIVFAEKLVRLLGASEELVPESSLYLSYIAGFTLLFLGGYSLGAFVRVDGRPVLASMSLISTAIGNVLLDWWLIAVLGWGVKGAAIATGSSYVFGLILLLPHFLSGKGKLRFKFGNGRWREVWSSCYNGLSELTNELSVGLVILFFNRIMISKMGVPGVAAFSVINYMLWFGMMVAYGISDSLLPIISTNFGARFSQRISRMLAIACASVLGLGVILFALLSLVPETIIGIFLQPDETETIAIASQFISILKWTFLLNGLNIVLTAYFTSMHKPMESVMVAISRSLILPLAALATLPQLFGDVGIYFAIPLSEIITFSLAIYLLIKNNPARLVILSARLPVKQPKEIGSRV